MIKVSDYITKYLENLGVKHVFMLSGGGAIHIVDSIGKSKKIQYVCNLHEQGCGIAAEAYSQYTNKLGVALVTTGPGSTNIITPIAGAWLDSIPMLVLCGQVNTYDMVDKTAKYPIRQKGFQEIDMVGIVKNITKYSATVLKPEHIKQHLDTAIRSATTGRPGPVVLEIPLDIQSAMVDESRLSSNYSLYNIKSVNLELFRPLIENVIDDLKQSKRPIILAGNGIRLAGALDDFHSFIDETKIPVLLTWKALDFLEETHPLYVGRPGTIASLGANLNQQNADFILCIGARLDAGQIAYMEKNFAPNAKKTIVDIDRGEATKINSASNQINMCAKQFLTLFRQEVKKISLDTKDWLKQCKETYRKNPVISKRYFRESQDHVNLYTFIDLLSRTLPTNSLVIPGSSGACSEVTMQALRIKKGTRVFNTEGLGSMGYGIPAAIGGCLAAGKNNTICIDGDGGFFMNIQELEVVRRLKLPIKFFVLNNNGYGSIVSTQTNFFNGDLVGSNPKSGMTLPSIEKNARAYGIDYIKIRNYNELSHKLHDILRIETPVICELMIGEKHKTLPKVKVQKMENGTFQAMTMENMNV